MRIALSQQASDEMTALMKELNACCLSHITTARGQIQLEMMRFADKLYAARSRVCSCCTTRAHVVSPPELPLLPKVSPQMTTSLFMLVLPCFIITWLNMYYVSLGFIYFLLTCTHADDGVATPATTPFAGRRLQLSSCEGLFYISPLKQSVSTVF